MDYTYNPTQKHMLDSVTVGARTYDFTYDANGNMETGYDLTDDVASRQIAYNAENKPVQVVYGNKARTIDFVYDGEGGRAKKILQGKGQSGSTTYYISGGYEITDGQPKRYIFAGGRRIASVSGMVVYYYHQDNLGSSAAMTNDEGNIAEASDYLPYGGMREHAGTEVTNYKYTGQELDPGTGLYYYGARYYDTALGRFVSPDSIVPDPFNPQAFNRYAYVLNNPMIYTDPTGHETSACVCTPDGICSGCEAQGDPGGGGGAGGGDPYDYGPPYEPPPNELGDQIASEVEEFGEDLWNSVFNRDEKRRKRKEARLRAALGDELYEYRYIHYKDNPYVWNYNNFDSHLDNIGSDSKTWVYLTGGAGGGVLGYVALEGGTYYLIDPLTSRAHHFVYLSGGFGRGMGGAAQYEIGLFEGPSDPLTISPWTLTVSAFAAAGPGVSGQVFGTSFWGQGEMGGTIGGAAGAGFGIAGMGTYSWHLQSGAILSPENEKIYKKFIREYLRR
jgi:RHS repeat-associated protein